MIAISSVRQASIDLSRNLQSGLRLAFGLPVSLLAFRVNVRQLLLLLCIDVLIGVTNDYVRAGADPTLSMHAIVYEGFEAAALLVMGALLSAAFRQPHLRLAVPVIVLASDPAAGVLNFVLALPGNQGAVLGYSLQWLGFWLLVAWIAFIYWRAIATALMPRQPRFCSRASRWRSGRTSRGSTPRRRRRSRERSIPAPLRKRFSSSSRNSCTRRSPSS